MNTFKRTDLFSAKTLIFQPYVPATTRANTSRPITDVHAVQLTSNSVNPKEESNAVEYSNKIRVCIEETNKKCWDTQLNIKIKAKHNLYIELTDDKEQSFLFTMECTESSFLSIKKEQALTVEFHQFPNMIIDLLELTQKPSGKFYCLIQPGHSEIVLNLNEHNGFNIATHLFLHFKAADDEVMRENFSKKYQVLRTEYEELKKKLTITEQEAHHFNEKLNNELKKQSNEHSKLIDMIKLENQKQVESIKEQMKDELNALNEKHNKEKQAILKELTELQYNYTNLQQAKDKSAETNIKLQITEQELRNKVQTMQLTIEVQENELLKYKGIDNTKLIQELKTKYENTLAQLQEKELLVEKTNELYQAREAQMVQMEETIAILKRNSGKMEDKLILSVNEINKGNGIISQLQDKLKAVKQKLKTQDSAIAQYKKAAEDNGKLIEDYKYKEQELNNKQQKIEELNKKLEESQELLASNAQSRFFILSIGIQWLTKSLNEAQKTSLVPRATLPQAMPMSTNIRNFTPSYTTIDQVLLSPNIV